MRARCLIRTDAAGASSKLTVQTDGGFHLSLAEKLSNSISGVIEISDGGKLKEERDDLFPSGDRQRDGETRRDERTSGINERLYFHVEKVYVYEITIGTLHSRD